MDRVLRVPSALIRRRRPPGARRRLGINHDAADELLPHNLHHHRQLQEEARMLNEFHNNNNNRRRRLYFDVPLQTYLICLTLWFLFNFVCFRAVCLALLFYLQLPPSDSPLFFFFPIAGLAPVSSASSNTTTSALYAATSTYPPPSTTLIDKFVVVLRDEFTIPTAAPSPSDEYLFRFCGVLLYTLYALIIAFALSFSALFHSFSFVFFVWRKWTALGKGLYDVWRSEGGAVPGVW
ncbi:uncharacterized protein V1518DRAFT_410521 [Limtongia smithiae]|uniref:uncharacterized protein n=1 Tax=Limtongia smithiae TaxID=1125753 RepID=UPI0034CFACAB